MRELIIKTIKDFVKEYENIKGVKTRWKEPLVGFANAEDPDFLKLKDIVLPNYQLPQDIIEDAKTVVSYFLPFVEDIPKTNKEPGLASNEWAIAYRETNTMINELNRYMISFLKERGYGAGVSDATFFRDKLKSNWSQRHVANIAGLGTFGMNNMLITEKGCCGRYGSFVTSLAIEASPKYEKENCLYKFNKTCGVCMSHCPAKALTSEGFEREKCFEICEKNAKVHEGLEICGKCDVNIPCAFKIPKRNDKITGTVLFETERLVALRAKEEDINYIVEAENHEENKWFVWQGTYEEHLAEIDNEKALLVVFKKKDTGEKVGYTLNAVERRWNVFELSRIAVTEKKKGYGREIMNGMIKYSFEELNTNRFWLDVYPEHSVGIHLYESLGMKWEGTLRNSYRDESGYKDQHIYSILRKEYFS